MASLSRSTSAKSTSSIFTHYDDPHKRRDHFLFARTQSTSCLGRKGNQDHKQPSFLPFNLIQTLSLWSPPRLSTSSNPESLPIGEDCSDGYAECSTEIYSGSRGLEARPKKKKRLWRWGFFKALTHLGHQRFGCAFSVLVHRIEGLPHALDGLRLAVKLSRKQGFGSSYQTIPVSVYKGEARFQERICFHCSIYASKSPEKSVYMPKFFTLSVVAVDVDELVLSLHNLDLSRLLQSDANEQGLYGGKDGFTTTMTLFGKARGGSLVISFAYEFLDKDLKPDFVYDKRLRDQCVANSLESCKRMSSTAQSMVSNRPRSCVLCPALSKRQGSMESFCSDALEGQSQEVMELSKEVSEEPSGDSCPSSEFGVVEQGIEITSVSINAALVEAQNHAKRSKPLSNSVETSFSTTAAMLQASDHLENSKFCRKYSVERTPQSVLHHWLQNGQTNNDFEEGKESDGVFSEIDLDEEAELIEGEFLCKLQENSEQRQPSHHVVQQ